MNRQSSATGIVVALLSLGLVGNHATAQNRPERGEARVSEMSIGEADRETVQVKREDPRQIRVGQPFTYKIGVTNTSDSQVHNVTVWEKTPENLDIEESKPTLSQGSSAGKQMWSLGSLSGGETKQIQVSAIPQQEGSLRSCLGVDFQPTLCTQLQVVKPELEFSRRIVDEKGQPKEQFFACEDIYAQYRVTNVGSGESRPVRIHEPLTGVLRAPERENGVELEAAPLAAEDTFEERVRLQSTGEAGEYTGRATATVGEEKLHSSKASVRILKPQLQLEVSGPKEGFVNSPLTYEFEVKNISDAPALNTMLRLEPPENARRVRLSGRDVQAGATAQELGRIEPGESRQMSMTFDTPEPGRVSLQGLAQAFCTETANVQVATQIAGIPAARLEVIDLRDPVPVGEETTYEIRVKNQGSAEDLNVDVEANLPPSLEFVDGRGDTAVQGNGQTVKFGRIKRLGPGEMANWYVKAKANKAGQVRFRLEMTSDAASSPVIEQEPTTLYE